MQQRSLKPLLSAYLLVNRPCQPNKQNWPQEIIDKYFNIFVHLHTRGKNNTCLQQSAKIILGIDPGTLIMGYSIIECSHKKVHVREMHALQLSSRKITTSACT